MSVTGTWVGGGEGAGAGGGVVGWSPGAVSLTPGAADSPPSPDFAEASTAVCVGSCLFTVAGSLVPHTDPTRVAAQIVTGIGFLGAGAILRSGRSIHGLTTAAAIWVAAAIGMAVGFRLFILAGLATLMVVAALVVLQYVEDLLVRVRERWSSPPT